MHNRTAYIKYSVIGVLFSVTLIVFSATGRLDLSKPVAASLLSDDNIPFSASAQVDASCYAPDQNDSSAKEGDFDLQTKVDEIKSLYSSSAMQKSTVDAKPTEAQPELTVSDAQAFAGKPVGSNKTMASVETPVSSEFVNANELNVRSGAGTDYDKVATLKRKEKIGLISVNGDWAKIQTSSGKTGYTLSEYLVANESDVNPEEPAAYWFINADTLNVRSGAGTDFDKITTLNRGDKVGYFDNNGEWARIQTSGKTGYVLLKYLVDEKEKSVVVSRAPVATAATGEVTELAQQIANYSTNFQGIPYVYGGYSKNGLDCSGFVKYVYSHFGIAVPRSSGDYANFGKKVARENLRASDILLFDTDGGGWDVSHVGIYLGGDKFIHASTSKGEVIIMSFSEYRGKYYGARRVIK